LLAVTGLQRRWGGRVLGRKGSVWEKPPRREPPIAAEVRDDAARIEGEPGGTIAANCRGGGED